SPAEIEHVDFRDKTVVQTTSAGTQGIVNATGASQIITGSFNNAGAAASYIKSQNPGSISLVAMGHAGIRRADEDILCAQYIRSLLKTIRFPPMPLSSI
ncbi:MAG: 2-phosphosulfolactate phosphatase, partial [Calditrichia bacterium]